MQNAWRIGIGAAVLVAALVLFLVLRPGDDDDGTLASDTAAVTTGAAPTDATPTDTAPADTGQSDTTGANPNFKINVPAAGPSKVEELEVQQGQQVKIVVTTGDHWNIHLHGYDIELHTGPGLPPAQFQFRADTPGSFEMEIEDTGTPIAELNVTP